MRLRQRIIRGGSAFSNQQDSALDPNALLYLYSIGETDPIVIEAVNKVFTGLKLLGLFSFIKLLYLFPGTTPFKHKFNAVNPYDTNAAFRLDFDNVTHSKLGLHGNGIDAFASTHFNPLNDLVGHQVTITHSTPTDIGSGGANPYVDYGIQDVSGNVLYGFPRHDNRLYSKVFQSSTYLTALNLNSDGVYHSVRSSSTVSKVIKDNAVMVSGNLSNFTARPNGELKLLCQHIPSSGGTFYHSARIMNFFSVIEKDLTDREAFAYSQIIQDYNSKVR